MSLVGVSVRRPVMAAVFSALIVLFGVLGYQSLSLRELPDVDRPVVSVIVTYRGANAEVVENRVTQVIEDALSGIAGLDEIVSTSLDGRSNIDITFSLGRDIDAAANDVRGAVARAQESLPEEINPPNVRKQEADSRPIIWYSLTSDRMSIEELTDFSQRYLRDRFAVIDGVSQVLTGGNLRYAIRVWLDADALAARQLTASDIESALRARNVELPGGFVEAPETDLTVRIQRSYNSPEDFERLPVSTTGDGTVIRLGDVAEVELSALEPRNVFRGNAVPQVGIGLVRQSQANDIALSRAAHAEAEAIRATLPDGMELLLSSDNTVFVSESLKEVWRTLLIAALLVVGVIYLFLGSLRAAAIPAVVVPVCLVGVFSVLAAFGFSINIVTLLALVLCVGLVVDDSIVVLENIQRRADLGEPPMLAALNGGNQVIFAVVATTAVLVAVFVPLIFLPGVIGRVFVELAITISGAVVLSSVAALTLSPMMASKIVVPSQKTTGLSRWVHEKMDIARDNYRASLEMVLRRPMLVLPLVLVAILGALFFFNRLPGELTPTEDRGSFFASFTAQEGAGFDYTREQSERIEAMLMEYVDAGEIANVIVRIPGFGGSGYSSGVVFGTLTPWGDRDRGGPEIVGEINERLGQVPGLRAFASMRSSLAGESAGSDIQFVLGGDDYAELGMFADELVAAAQQENPQLVQISSDYWPTSPRLVVDVDVDRAADLGVSDEQVARTLETHLGSRRVGEYVDRGESYYVVLQNRREQRASLTDLEGLYLRSGNGDAVPLSSIVSLTETGEASERTRVNRFRSVSVSATLADGYSLGDAVEWFEGYAQQNLPETVRTQFLGGAQEYQEANRAAAFAFGMALLIVFLVLAAQFESLLQPLVIMLTVPLAVAGGLFGLYIAGSSLNIYSQIGLIVLIGLAAKNGILIVEFANQLRDEGKDVVEAALEAAETRFRPIIMTGLSTAAGAIPLIMASGPGAESRITIGLVIFTGVLVATLFTLIVIPSTYAVVGRYTKTPQWTSRQLERFAREHEARQDAAGDRAGP
ncbi:efflux RND transporter permease subunit [Luteimonas sp. MJ293]|uniref:efflux RND transporter permease subunit n=1 Tax=Luteimonas sp. MJ146 TaxID=3129240 RepID=UPI0031B9F847